jgi:GNAT superfamily N-acetyltransferase
MIKTISSKDLKLTSEQIERLYSLMIFAYARTEIEIWGHDYIRMNKDKYLEILKEDGFLIALINNQIVGSVYVYPLSDTEYGFGLLNADFALAGKGIGSSLVQAAEKYAKQKGAQTIKIEILRPKDFVVSSKEILKEWYLKFNYSFVETIDFLTLKPTEIEKSKRMVNPSVFDMYQKDL